MGLPLQALNQGAKAPRPNLTPVHSCPESTMLPPQMSPAESRTPQSASCSQKIKHDLEHQPACAAQNPQPGRAAPNTREQSAGLEPPPQSTGRPHCPGGPTAIAPLPGRPQRRSRSSGSVPSSERRPQGRTQNTVQLHPRPGTVLPAPERSLGARCPSTSRGTGHHRPASPAGPGPLSVWSRPHPPAGAPPPGLAVVIAADAHRLLRAEGDGDEVPSRRRGGGGGGGGSRVHGAASGPAARPPGARHDAAPSTERDGAPTSGGCPSCRALPELYGAPSNGRCAPWQRRVRPLRGREAAGAARTASRRAAAAGSLLPAWARSGQLFRAERWCHSRLKFFPSSPGWPRLSRPHQSQTLPSEDFSFPRWEMRPKDRLGVLTFPMCCEIII